MGTLWQFSKMHGAGNDFVVLDGVRQSLALTPAQACALADRHFGIGADQVLLVETPQHPDADFRYRIFNADGGEVEHCGNGARCFVRFVHEQGLSRRNPLRAEIQGGLITLTEQGDGRISVGMGQPGLTPASVHFDTRGLASLADGQDTLWQLPLPGYPDVALSLVSMPNPHAVLRVDALDQAPVATLGPLLENHPRFGQRVNVGFMQVLDRHHAKLRVYERGSGETLACGTGACAAAIAGIRRGLLESPVRIQTRGGPLDIEWDADGVRMSGPAVTVFSGTIDIDALTDAWARRQGHLPSLTDVPKEAPNP